MHEKKPLKLFYLVQMFHVEEIEDKEINTVYSFLW